MDRLLCVRRGVTTLDRIKESLVSEVGQIAFVSRDRRNPITSLSYPRIPDRSKG